MPESTPSPADRTAGNSASPGASATAHAASGAASDRATSGAAAGRAGPGSRLQIGLSPDGVALVRRDGWFSKRWHVLSDQPLHAQTADTGPEASGSGKAGPQSGATSGQSGSNSAAEARQSASGVAPAHEVELLCHTLQQALQATACSKLTSDIILADGWARYFMVAPPKNVANMTDCRAAASMRFHQLYGESASDWQIHAEWDVNHPFLACALPNKLLTQIAQSAETQQLSLASITPFFIACWNRWCKNLQANAWFGVINAGFLTLAAIENGRLQAVRRSPFLPANWHDKQYLPTLLQREALRLNLAMPAVLQLCGNLPDARASEIMGTLECRRLDASLMLEAGAHGAVSSQLTLAMLGAHA